MTPAEELRTAAAKLRETAAKATPGPWDDCSTRDDGAIPRWILGPPTDPNDGWTRIAAVQITDDVAHAINEITDLESVLTREDTTWIALMSPALAEPLAVWLERMADEHEALCRAADAMAGVLKADSADLLRSGPICLDEALTSARAINRSVR